MRTTILSLTILTLSLGLVGCGGAGGSFFNPADFGLDDGSQPGLFSGMDDDMPLTDLDFYKRGMFVVFPFSDQGSAVQAGDDVVAFQQGSGFLFAQGVPLDGYALSPSGYVLQGQQQEPIGQVVYVETGDGQVGTALRSIAGLTLELVSDGDQVSLVETDAPLRMAAPDRAPRNAVGIPVAQPAGVN